MAIYNKMRPRLLSEMRGQEKIIKILRENLTGGHLPNAMLFVGTRGTGKTTAARIVSRYLNCEHPSENGEPCNECVSCKAILAGTSLDVKELDAASNNGVDDVRSLIEQLNFKPVGKMHVVILDEVHMLSTGAFNALLKVLEEPPRDTIFILCTTEYQKIPATILSRCRKFQFETIQIDEIIEKLKLINTVYGKEAEPAALYLVAQAAKGSMRDAESIYESFIDTTGVITEAHVRDILGFSPEETVFSILKGIRDGEPMVSACAIEAITEQGGSLTVLIENCLQTVMDIISVRLGGDISDRVPPSYLEQVNDLAFCFETVRLFEIANAFQKCYENRTANLLLSLKLMFIGLATKESSFELLQKKVQALESKITELETAISSGFSEKAAIKPEASVPFAQLTPNEDSACEERDIDILEELPSEEDLLADEPAVAPAVNNDTVMGGLGTVTNDDLSALSAMGFHVELQTAPQTNTESETVEAQKDVEETESSTMIETNFFDDFARQFGL